MQFVNVGIRFNFFRGFSVIFYLAKRWYRVFPHEDNLIVKICKCIGVSTTNFVFNESTNNLFFLNSSMQ